MEANKKSKELRPISLPSNSNEVKLDYSVPLTEVDFDTARLGKKSTEQQKITEHQLLEYQKRVSKKETVLSSEELRILISETNDRRRMLEESINEQKEAFQQKRASELTAHQSKEREESRAYRLSHETDFQRTIREESERNIQIARTKEIQAIQNKNKKEREEVIVFFEQSSNSFNSKYGNVTKRMSGDTGIDRLISSRRFTHRVYANFAHRCIVCGYHNPESLSISKIYIHLFENKDKHLSFALNEVDNYYNTQIQEIRKRHAQEDNPDLKHQRLDKEIEALRKRKGVNYS